MYKLKEFIQHVLFMVFRNSKIKDIIIFESYPTFSDNSKCVYDEFIRRHINERYTICWFVGRDNFNPPLTKIKNVYFLDSYHGNILQRVYYMIKKTKLLCCAKCVIVSNKMLTKGNKKEKQFFIDLAHGAALKNCRHHYNANSSIDSVVCLSSYLAKYDAINLDCSVSKLVPLGYARNDSLFGEKKDIRFLFPEMNFDKVVFWMPTYRQNSNSGDSVSNISIPIIHNPEALININSFLSNNNMLVIVKPHPAQDLTFLDTSSLSNIVFIDDSFFYKNGLSLYELLRSVDALLTDYSSVYYDYLLCDKPIGLCFEDYEEYSKNEGFTVDPDFILSGGERIYDANDFTSFLSKVINGEDSLYEKRNSIKMLCHSHIDSNSTNRIVDYIIKYANL